MKTGRIIAIAAGIAAAAFVGYRFTSSKKAVKTADTRPSVITVHPENRNITVYTEQIGTIEPTQSVSVFPKIAGEILSVNFNAGDTVNAGDVLATINSDALTSLKIQMDAAKLNMDDAAMALSRTQALADSGAVSAQALEQASSAATGARLNYEAAKSQYDLQSSYTNVKAPISGAVETKSVEVHDMVAVSTPVAVISSNNGVEVKFSVTSDVQSSLKVGDIIKAANNGTEYIGTVTEISNVVSATTGLYDAKASLNDASALQTGTKVKLTLLKNNASNVIAVPLSAVLYSGNKAFVYVYEAGKAVKKDITVGIYDSEFIEVKEGLSVSDDVISTWSNEMYDGANVVLSKDIEGVSGSEDTDSTNIGGNGNTEESNKNNTKSAVVETTEAGTKSSGKN